MCCWQRRKFDTGGLPKEHGISKWKDFEHQQLDASKCPLCQSKDHSFRKCPKCDVQIILFARRWSDQNIKRLSIVCEGVSAA